MEKTREKGATAGRLTLFRPFSDRNLNLCQPTAFVLLIPDPINVAFPNGSCDFIPVFFDVFENGFIGFRQGSIGAFVINAGRLSFRQGSEIQAADFLLCPGDGFADFYQNILILIPPLP